MKKEVLRIERVTMEQENIVYLDDFSLWVSEGEILGMIVANQHGMDQLIELIMQNITLKYGRVYFEGVLVNDYIREGKGSNRVCVIDNRIRLVPGLTVADNIFVLRKGFKKYVINSKVIEQQVRQTFRKLKISIPADALAESLSTFERCEIELIKAVMSGIRFIIIRDISTIISYVDIQKFYDLIKYYKKQGITFLYIGHHHEEVFQVCTRVVLYDNGKIIKVFYPEDMDKAHIMPLVHPIKEFVTLRKNTSECILKMEHVSTGKLHDFSCEIFPGECLTILDKDHSMLDDFIGVISGEANLETGDIYFEGKLRKKKKRDIQRDIMIIPEDPVHRYLFLDQSYLYNLCFQIDQKIERGVIPLNVKKSIIKEWEQEIGKNADALTLRGLPAENLYDLLYYRILLYHPKIALLIQPFSGADMYLRVHIANLISRMKERNITVVILTSYMADALAVTDQLILMEKGMQVAEKNMLNSRLIKNNYYKDRFVGKVTKENK